MAIYHSLRFLPQRVLFPDFQKALHLILFAPWPSCDVLMKQAGSGTAPLRGLNNADTTCATCTVLPYVSVFDNYNSQSLFMTHNTPLMIWRGRNSFYHGGMSVSPKLYNTQNRQIINSFHNNHIVDYHETFSTSCHRALSFTPCTNIQYLCPRRLSFQQPAFLQNWTRQSQLGVIRCALALHYALVTQITLRLHLQILA